MTTTQATEPRTYRSETAAEVVGRLRATFNTGVTRPLDWRVPAGGGTPDFVAWLAADRAQGANARTPAGSCA
ncbi:hypothetical protein Sipo8835_06100 [Streptomyces ipomoeae]|uniref:Uncharacterized protein n=1 Tax=Streptomyces ipomoeae TaxID=103232 RepID=A0AAE8W7B5_9ACTN|nr:hypothetical protein [Streptomyces ipomoeae]TQE38099.1 hypothetical protein Sipo8835_06100 [Streptomyces ipomoeae]